MYKIPRPLLIVLLDVGILLLVLLAVPLSSWMMDTLPNCIVAELGYLCPACGSTRCVRALLSADFASAFRLHPLLCILLAHLSAILLLLNLGWLANLNPCRRAFRLLTDPHIFIGWAVAYVLFGILRNIV